jgi:hypothetical protein
LQIIDLLQMLGKKTGFEHIRSKVQAILCSPQRWQLTCLSSVAQVLSHRTPRVLILAQSLTVLLASRPTLGHAKYTHSSQVSLMSGAPSCIRFFPKMCPKFEKKGVRNSVPKMCPKFDPIFS